MFARFNVSRRALLVLLGCAVCQMGAGLFYASRALAPDVIDDLGWTRTMWSAGMAPMLFVSSLSQAFVGSACVRFGIRPVMVTSLLLLALTFAVLSAMTTIWHFYLAMALLALGNAGIGDVVVSGVVTHWFDRARGLALGFAFVGSNVGAIVFVHIIAVLAQAGSWRTATLTVGLGSIAVILPVAVLCIRDPRAGESAGVRDPEEGNPSSSTPEFAGSIALDEAMRRPGFWVLFYTLFCYALAQLGVVDHLILYLTDIGYSKVEAAGALELTMGAGIISKLGAGVIALRLSAKTALIANTALLAASFALIPFASDPYLLVVFGVAFGVATSARDVLFPLLVAEAFGPRYIAAIYGFFMLSFFPGGGLGPIGLARLHDVLGSYAIGCGICAGMLGLAGWALFTIPLSAEEHSS